MSDLNQALASTLANVQQRARQLAELIASGKKLPALKLCRAAIDIVQAESKLDRHLAELSRDARS